MLNNTLAEENAPDSYSKDWKSKVGAQTEPLSQKTFKVNDYGVDDNRLILCTNAIQAAIDACAQKGDGIVVFEPGVYLTGSIFLKEGVHLRIDKGVELRGVMDISRYPEIDTRIAGIEMTWPAALINVIGQDNVAISGEGVIHGQGRPHWEKFWNMYTTYQKEGIRWAVDYDCKRPRTILISESSNITLKGTTIKQAGFWTIHVLYSKFVTIDGVIIKNNIEGHGPSTDGIDIDSSSYILVQNCDIDCHDDNFCLKAGRDADGLRVNRPTEYVIIRDCIARTGHGLLTIGSETSGGVRYVDVYNLKAYGTHFGIRFKSAKTRGGIIENISFHDIEMEKVNIPIYSTLNWYPSYSYTTLPAQFTEVPEHWKKLLEKVEPPEKGIPVFRKISFSDIKAIDSGQPINTEGLENSYLDDFSLKNVYIQAHKPGKIAFARNWTLENVRFETPLPDPVELDKCENINWK